MTYTSRSMFTVPLTSKAYQIANYWQSQYEEYPAKARQVYLNNLAVYAVDTYCHCLGIETDLESCDSLNTVMQALMDIADLEIAGIGKIECRPMLPEDDTCYIPTDAWENRIGYIAVEIDEPAKQATLLGFYPPVNALEMMERISFESFQPLEAFLDYLDRLESGKEVWVSKVAKWVRERLADLPIGEIVAQMERIYRTCNPNEWRYAGGEFLLSLIAPTKNFAFRGDKSPASVGDLGDEEIELQDVAEDLLDKLDEIWSEAAGTTPKKLAAAVTQVTPIIVPQPATPAANGFISLGEWLQNPEQISAEHWLPLASYLNGKPANLIFRFANAPRSGSAEPGQPTTIVSKVSEISLGGHPLVLFINCEVKSDDQIDILVRLYPGAEEQPCLPPGLQLVVIDNKGEVFLEAESRSADNWIQLQFWGEPAEQFSIKLVLGDDSITQEFVI